MAFRHVENPSAAEWDARIAANPDGGTMFQTFELGEIKRVGHWRPRYAVCDDVAMTIHEKSVPGLGKVWYLPKGPGVATMEQLAGIMPQLARAGREAGAFMVKIEPELRRSDEHAAALRAGGMLPVAPVQPNSSTLLMDLTGSLDDVFARINKKRRTDIRRAEREGVVVENCAGTDQDYRDMFALWTEVIEDHGLALRDEEYYTRFWRIFLDSGLGALFLARFEGRPVAGAFVVALGEKSTYKDGASVRERPVRGASHLLQWHVIQWAHERGVTEHDLCGGPPSDRFDDPTHPYHGIGQFKKAFSEGPTDWVGAWDLPLAKGRYALFNKLGRRVVTRLQSTGPGDGFY